MKPFSNQRIRRKTAVAALFVFVFALSSGVANACLLESPDGHTHPRPNSTETGSAPHHPHVALPGHSEAVESGGHDSNIPEDACLKVCDDGSRTPVKLQAGSDLRDPGMAPLVATVWDEATPAACAPSEMNDLRPPMAGPPLRVRYSRLAL